MHQPPKRSAVAQAVICGAIKIGDRRTAGSSLTTGGVTVLCPLARHSIRYLGNQPRKTWPNMTEKLLTET